MKLTILGKSPAWTDAGGACSGYLVEEEGTRLLIDCGNGIFAKLREAVDDWLRIDAVVISHIHADHFLDLVPFAYALKFSAGQLPEPAGRLPAGAEPARPPLAVPPGALAKLRRVVGGWGSEELIEETFEAREYDPESGLEVGALDLSFAEVPHFTPTYAIDVRSRRCGRFTFGADCARSDALAELAGSTPLLIAEATLPGPDAHPAALPAGHMTPADAGELARAAGAERLLLTHISDERDLERARAEAGERFGGVTEIAREGQVYEL